MALLIGLDLYLIGDRAAVKRRLQQALVLIGFWVFELQVMQAQALCCAAQDNALEVIAPVSCLTNLYLIVMHAFLARSDCYIELIVWRRPG